MELSYIYYPMDLLMIHIFFLAETASDRMCLVYLEEREEYLSQCQKCLLCLVAKYLAMF
jgi:septum formation topological specificity factor MinE